MSRRWEENRTDGRLCLVIDPEDGTHPQRVYGKDKDEILEKVATTVEHSSRHIAALKAQPARSLAAPPPGAGLDTRPAPRKSMTPDEQMQRTSDLTNPAKAPAAVAALLDEATGGALDDFKKFQLEQRRKDAVNRFANTAAGWADRHPEFPRSPSNNKMLADSAALRAGGLDKVTEETLDTVYQELLEGDYLQESPPAGQPDETPATRPARAATSYRRNGLRATTPAPSSQLRYTRAQVDAMPADKLLEKYKGDAEFRRAVDTYAQPRSATA
jgi:hypothetical protein